MYYAEIKCTTIRIVVNVEFYKEGIGQKRKGEECKIISRLGEEHIRCNQCSSGFEVGNGLRNSFH